MRRGLKIFLKSLCFLAIIATIPNYYSVIFKFGQSQKFNGDQFYNPYENISGHWIKANLHAHVKAYGGIANGKNTAEEMLYKYDSLKYDLAVISNYNSIHDSVSGYKYLPVYEHGFNWMWIHQHVINETEVKWFDFPFFQFRSNKQFVINRLKTDQNLIALNHPNHKKAYTKKDLKYLNNYDFIEGISEFANSIKQWDVALSNGHAVWIVGNDDSHDLSDYHVGLCWNMINVDTLSAEAIVENLKVGASYATKGWLGQEMNRLKAVTVEDGFYKMKLERKSDSIMLYSDNGIRVAVALKTDSISYKIKPNNSYIRAELFETEPWNGYTRMYINPIVRTKDGKLIQHNNENRVSYFLSFLYWVGLLILHIIIITLIRKW